MTTDEQKAEAAAAAVRKINEGLSEFIQAVADEGEPEVVENAVLLFEARGMSDAGFFTRRDHLVLEMSGQSAMLGMFELVSADVQHALRCGGHHG